MHKNRIKLLMFFNLILKTAKVNRLIRKNVDVLVRIRNLCTKITYYKSRTYKLNNNIKEISNNNKNSDVKFIINLEQHSWCKQCCIKRKEISRAY